MKPIPFKSAPEYFDKEKDGRKPNTVRDVDKDDARFWDLQLLHDNPQIMAFIEIENTETGETFLREITDVSYFKGQAIVSWRHREVAV